MSSETKMNIIQNTLPLIAWKPGYDLRIYILDEQHRGIVAAINSLYYGMQTKQSGDMLIPIFKIMHEYAHIHFKTEEEFHEKFDFPNAISHRALHRELTGALSKIGEESITHHDPHELMDFLKKWWIDHIRDKDRVFRDYLLEKSFIAE